MSARPSIALPQREPETLFVRMVVDPPGQIITEPAPRHRVAIHVGRSAYMTCRRGGLKHSGLAVHGDIDVIPAFTECIWEPKQEDVALVIGVPPALLARIAEESGKPRDCLDVRNRFQIRDPQIENIGWALKAELEAGYPSGRIFRDSLGAALAECLLRRHSKLPHVPEPRTGLMGSRTLKQVLAFIEEDLSRELTLSEIAGVAGVSVSHFKAMFRQAVGVPIHQYIIQRRVQTAASLLRNGNLPISQIAQETGFTHQSHLAHHTRRLLGYSPKAIRALATG
jgi:AraC family transcriptional regulator